MSPVRTACSPRARVRQQLDDRPESEVRGVASGPSGDKAEHGFGMLERRLPVARLRSFDRANVDRPP